ncbi:MAG: cyclic nucleotide-binding domain-containing protein [Devosia sp.]
MDLLALTATQDGRNLGPEEVLVTQGTGGGDLYILEYGALTVTRDGIEIATLSEPGTLVGEMSVLLGTHYSATVRAARDSRVRVIREAKRYLANDPELTLAIAALVAGRLDATSALMVEMSREHAGKPSEQGLLRRIFSALLLPAEEREPG